MANQSLTIVIFGAFVAATLLVTGRLARRKVSADGFYTGDKKLTGWQNGIAISGDHLSAASLLGFTGLIALHGYDSLAYPLTVIVSYVLVLVLVAEPLRNLGRITIADALAVRMGDRSVRAINAVCGLFITLAYLISQVVGAASLAKVLLGIDTKTSATLAMVVIGVLMLVYVVFGGMNATTWVQIFKASLLMGAVVLIVVLTAVHFGFSPGRLVTGLNSSSASSSLLTPGGLFHSKLEVLSFSLGNVLGTAGLPHVMMRFYTVSTAEKARASATWTLGIIGLIYVFILVLGFGAASIVGKATIAKTDPSGNSALPLLAQAVGGGAHTVGGSIMLAVVGALSFATILAVVAGLTISASSNVAHDFYANVIRKGRTTPPAEVRVGKLSAAVLAVVAVAASIALQDLNVAFLASLGFTVAASTNVPVLLYTLYWRRFTATGARAAMLVGLVSSTGLIMISPNLMGPAGLFARDTEPLFPLAYVGIVSIPLAFLAGAAGSLLSRVQSTSGAAYNSQRRQMLVGAAGPVVDPELTKTGEV